MRSSNARRNASRTRFRAAIRVVSGFNIWAGKCSRKIFKKFSPSCRRAPSLSLHCIDI